MDRAGRGRVVPLMFASCGGALAIAGLVAWLDRPIVAMLLVGLGALAAAIFAPRERRLWVTAGIGYAGAMLLAPMFLRADDSSDLLAIVLLFAIVWTTDIFGYFAGRAFGGPKLLPAVSPKKTWSGAIAGTLGAIVVALLRSRACSDRSTVAAIVAVALLLVDRGAGRRSVRNRGSSAGSAPRTPASSFPAMAA